MQYSTLLSSLLGVVDASLPKASTSAVAQCIAGMTRKAGDTQAKSTVSRFVGDVKPGAQAHVAQIALLVLGEIGQTTDLSDVKGIDTTVISAMDSKDDAVRSAAAFALGNISIGNLTKFVPTWLDLVKKASAQNQYLLFASMKEALTTLTRDKSTLKAFAPYVDQIVPTLQQQAEAKDEGVRSMVASCLGLLCLVDTVKMLSLLEKILGSTSAHARATMVTALRFSFSPFMEWPNLAAKLDSFLTLLKDKDLTVRRETLLTVNALARASIECIRAKTLKDAILPALYEETKIKPELIHERDYGAFKETVDDGLPLRKAAYQCLGTLLDVCPHRLSMQEYIQVMQQGLIDNSDIQVTTFQIFGYIALYHGSSLLEILNSLPDMLMKSIKTHMTAAKAKEPDPVAIDCLRAFLRAMGVFNKIPGVELCTKYTHFYKQVCATPILAQMQKELDASG
jgi:cullin-associated NEDD8-dissociated protein 1